MKHSSTRLLSLVIGLVIVSSLVSVDPGALALLNAEFLAAAGAVALAMTREHVRTAWQWLLVSDVVSMLRVAWRMTRADPRSVMAAG